MEIKIIDAGDVAKKRFYDYLDEKLKGERDTTSWEFFNYLLKEAKNYKLDYSGYGSLEYQQDRDEARAVCKQRNSEYKEGEFRLPERGNRRRF